MGGHAETRAAGRLLIVCSVGTVLLLLFQTEPFADKQEPAAICETSDITFNLRLDGLQKDIDGISSRYVITNTGSDSASAVHQFCDIGDQLVYSYPEPLPIPTGAARQYELASMQGLFSGYQGYVIVSSNQPVTGSLLLPLVTPVPEATLVHLPAVFRTVPTATPTATPTVVSPTSIPSDPCLCDQDRYNCSDFGSQYSAQACYGHCLNLGRGDIHRLDGDNDGIACE